MRISRRLLYVTVPAVAIVLVTASLLIGSGAVHTGVRVLDGGPPKPWQFPIAVGITAVAQLARLRIRVGNAGVWVAWGEAAAVVLCSMLPLPWVGPALVVGVSFAQVAVVLLGERRDGAHMAYSTGSLTLAGMAAAVVANAITPTYGMPLRPLVAVALTAGALGYAAVGSFLVSVHVVSEHGGRVRQVLGRALRGKLLMLVGNIAVGLLVVALSRTDMQWLVLLPPGLWLMHQTYLHRMRGDDERRVWQTFAEATRELNRLDLADAAGAGLRGALRLFQATSAVLLVDETGGGQRCYRGHPDGRVEECEPLRLDGDPYQTARTLMVGGVRVGELRLRMPSASRMRHRDLLMFAAYGDALAAALHDATTHDALRAMTERSAHDAVTDHLTGLPNRVGFLARGDMVVRELPADLPVALLLLDIDHFREVNDTLGHAAGDELLLAAADRLAAALAPGEMAARLGGDEFAVLFAALPDDMVAAPVPAELAGAEYPHQLAHATRRARRIAEALASPIEVAGVQLSKESSVGVVVAAAGEVDLTELLRRADVAMYQAKRGGSAVAWYDASRDPASTDRLALLAEMREALASGDQLALLIQPAVPLAGGPAISGEALVRWQHPRRGTLAPSVFLSVVEHSELIGPFTRHVLDRALAIAADWSAAGLDLPIAVNMSPRSLLDPRLPRDVAVLLERRRVRPERLVLEITETVVMSELPVIDDVLRKLRDLGIQLAVDDFGTGYSSLTFLTRVAVDQVKVDKTFVHRMVDSPEAAAIVRTTVDLGRRLGLRVVAEGVETAEQRAALVALGCTVAQGYLFHHPMSPERAIDKIIFRHQWK